MPSPAVPRFVDQLEDFPPPGAFAARPGMEIMQGVPGGRLPAPPIRRRLGFRLADAAGRRHAQGSTACLIFDF